MTPRTEAGRRYGFWVDPDEEHPRTSVEPFNTVWHAIRAIEDEERERIAALAAHVGEGVGSITRDIDGRAYDPAVIMRNAILAAITGEEAAP